MVEAALRSTALLGLCAQGKRRTVCVQEAGEGSTWWREPG